MKATLSNLTAKAMMLADPDLSSREFRKNVRRYLNEICLDHPREMVEDLMGTLDFTPDLHKIDIKAKEIICIEIEDTHTIPVDKLALMAYANEAFNFYPDTPRLRVFVTGRYGNNLHEIDLESYYIPCLFAGKFD